MRKLLVCVVVLVAGCVGTKSLTCADGRVCPDGSRCDDEHDRCINDQQLAACMGMADGADCTDSGVAGTCVAGACIPPVCGDGVRTAGEVCDGSDLAGQTCESRGYYTQSSGLACTADCKFDESGCDQRCGDGTRNGSEQCDGTDLGGDCTTAGFYDAGGLTCTSFCTWNVSQCTGRCGDGIINGGEICDGSPPPNGCLAYDFDYGTIGCSLCAPEYSHCGHTRWFADTVLPPDLIIRASATSVADTWVVGNAFAMHRSGTVWTTYTLPSTGSGGAIWNRGHNDVFVVGRVRTTGVFVPTVDHFDGTSFTQQLLPGVGGGDESTIDISGVPSGEGFAITNRALYHFDGTSWSLATAVPLVPHSVWVASPTDVWLTDQSNNVKQWNGTTPTPVTLPSAANGIVESVWGLDANHVYVALSNGIAIYTSGTWTFHASLPVFAVHGRSPNEIVAIGQGYAARFDGTYWYDISPAEGISGNSIVDLGTEILVPASTQLLVLDRTVWLSTPNGPDVGNTVYGLWVGGSMAFLPTAVGMYMLDESNQWYPSTLTNPVSVVYGFSPSDVWTDDGSSLYHWNGASWNPVAEPHGPASALWGTSSTDLWVASNDVSGNLYVDRGDGVSWTAAGTPPAGHQIYRLRGSSASDVWAVIENGNLMHYNGSTWSLITITGNPFFEGVWSFGPSSVIAVGPSGIVYTFDGASWTKVSVGTLAYLTDVWGRAPDDVYIVGGNGTLLHYDGASWTPVRDPRDGSNILFVYGTADHLVLAREDTQGGDVLYEFAPLP